MKDDDVKRAIASAEEALAKQEQGEPVSDPFDCGTYVGNHIGKEIKHTLGDCQPQRTWVGLTNEEAQWLYDNCRTPSNLIDMTEAKLKEKNT
jgi:hypothetical protein